MSTAAAPLAPSQPSPASQQQKQQATDFLQSLLNKNLRVTTTDSRMFWGSFKCTDYVSTLLPASRIPEFPQSPYHHVLLFLFFFFFKKKTFPHCMHP